VATAVVPVSVIYRLGWANIIPATCRMDRANPSVLDRAAARFTGSSPIMWPSIHVAIDQIQMRSERSTISA
jgi:hypothetical protein